MSVQLTVPSEDDVYAIASLPRLNLEEEIITFLDPGLRNYIDAKNEVWWDVLLYVVNYARVYGSINCPFMLLIIVPNAKLPFLSQRRKAKNNEKIAYQIINKMKYKSITFQLRQRIE